MALNPHRPARISNLRERITLQKRVDPDIDPPTWESEGTVYARVEPLRGDVKWNSNLSMHFDDQDYAISIRFRRDVRPGWRAIWHDGEIDRLLKVEAVSNMDERKRFLRLLCSNVHGSNA